MDMKRDFLAEYSGECLYHHGIMGQKWGIRRFQNKDGSLTEAGRKRYLNESGDLNEKGKKRFLSREDGTYYDLTRYSRKLGALGGIIDTARYAKEAKAQKVREQKKQAEESAKQKEVNSAKNDELDKELTKTGWKCRTDSYGLRWRESDGKMGDKDVRFSAEFSPEYDKTSPKDVADQANATKQKFQKEYKKVLSTAREAIAKEYYDTGEFERWQNELDGDYKGLSREQFKEEIPLSSVSLHPSKSESAYAELFFNDGKDMKYLMGDHVFTMEYDIDKDKAGHVSLEG